MNPMEERLRTRVRALCDDFYPRDAGHPEVLARAADHLGAEFRTLGLSSRRQEWTAGESRYANVIADVGPASEDRIVIGAHYDTAGAQPGADPDRLKKVVITVWLSERSGGGRLPDMGAPQQTLVRVVDPYAFGRRSPDSLRNLLQNIYNLIDLI